MNLHYQHKNVRISRQMERLVERKSKKTRRMLPTFRSPDLDLHVNLEKLSRGRQFQTVLVLTTPQRVIRVEAIEETPTGSIVHAFEELFRKVERFKSQLNRERFWQRQLPETESETRVTPGLVQALSTHLDKVENYIRRELFHRALVNHFPPGLLQPGALVDEVFLKISTRAGSRPNGYSLEQWMFQVARETVAQRVAELQETRNQAHLEEASNRDEQWDDEVLNFFQPDEALRLEDLLSDPHSPSPEELLRREETEEQIQGMVASLPTDLRDSFVLFALEGFNSDEVAMLTRKSPDQVRREVQQAREQLRQELIRT